MINNDSFSLEKRVLFMPLSKALDSDDLHYRGILSDTSIDRDDEAMSPELIQSWAKTKALPLLLDHKNEMSKLAGVWKDFGLMKSKDGKHQALTANLHILKSNPNTAWVADAIKEMDELGQPVGVSISAIPRKSVPGEKGSNISRIWTEAELIEATLTPIGSNRNSFAMVAKSFDLDKSVQADRDAARAAEEQEKQDEEVNKYIKEEDSQYCVYSKKGKKIACHATKKEAMEQLRAIEANKEFDTDSEMEKTVTIEKSFNKDGAHAHTKELPLGEHNHPEIEKAVDALWNEIYNLREKQYKLENPETKVEEVNSYKNISEEKTMEKDVKEALEDNKKEEQPENVDEPEKVDDVEKTVESEVKKSEEAEVEEKDEKVDEPEEEIEEDEEVDKSADKILELEKKFDKLLEAQEKILEMLSKNSESVEESEDEDEPEKAEEKVEAPKKTVNRKAELNKIENHSAIQEEAGALENGAFKTLSLNEMLLIGRKE